MILHADLTLARRLEEAESAISAEYAMACVPASPTDTPFVLPVAGGRAVFAGVGGVLTEAKALGMHGPVSDDELDRLEDVFFSRGATSKVVVCPLADSSLSAGLAKRGYRLVEFETILVRSLADLTDLPEPSPEVAIRSITAGETELYADVVATAFLHPEPVTPEFRDLCRAPLRASGITSWIASIGGEPAGGGSLLIRDGLALLAGAATLPDYRRRGIQTALTFTRLNLARDRGCELAMQGAAPGSTSQRTAERLGFRVAYTKAVLVREPG
jgi:GNAT superfamily N-acetyltransferase